MQTFYPPKTDIFLKYLLSMYRKKVGPKQAKDCNPEKHLHSCVVIVLREKVLHTKYSDYPTGNTGATSHMGLFKLKVNKI